VRAGQVEARQVDPPQPCESARVKSMLEAAAQVAHDIRSPLATIQVIEKALVLSSAEERLLLRNAIGRIREIANSLAESQREMKCFSVQPLSGLIDDVVREKRAQYRSRPALDLRYQIDQGTYTVNVKVQPVEFRRVLSNLIDNSVDSITGPGIVSVTCGADREFLQVTISDTGKGICPELLHKLGIKGVTEGKTGGSGLGVSHARTTLEAWGGRLELASEVGKGTVATLLIPRLTGPQPL